MDFVSDRLVLPSHAKINLFIHVLGRREDGYHELETLFQFLSLHDTLTFELTASAGIQRIDHHDFALPDHDLIVHTAELLRTRYGNGDLPGVKITLDKKIPPGSGMGGGSSNAATTLVAMQRLWQLGLTAEQMLDLAREIGADVPVFVYGKACWATARGDEFVAYDPEESLYCIVLPDQEVSTARIFNDPGLVRNHPPLDPREYSFKTTVNDLQPVTEKLYPRVAEAVDALSQFGTPRMNGSGSSIFLRCENPVQAQQISSALGKTHALVVARSFNQLEAWQTGTIPRT